MTNDVIPAPRVNTIQGREVNGKVYLQSRDAPDAVVCIACGRNVKVDGGLGLDIHHRAHEAQRDGTDPPVRELLNP